MCSKRKINAVGVLLLVASVSDAQTIENGVFDDGVGGRMSYRVYLPEGFDEPGNAFPVVMWLHGSGGSIGSRPQSLVNSLRSGPYAAVLVEPQGIDNWTYCDGAQNGSTFVYCRPGLAPGMELALGVLEEVESLYPIDSSRRVLTGYSAGSVGTFSLLQEEPGVFSAAIPIQGGGDARRHRRPIGTRLWVLHGHNDSFLLPYYSSSAVEAIAQYGESPIYQEPPGDHGAPFTNAFFQDVDNEVYPWMFDGIDPPLAQIVYNPASGNVAIDASTAPGGLISRFEISTRSSIPGLAVDEIMGDSIEVLRERSLRYTASDGLGFGGEVHLGEILAPGMNLSELHAAFATFNYDSPASAQSSRTFRVVIEPPAGPPALSGEVVEEPWVTYTIMRGPRERIVDPGLATQFAVGWSQRSQSYDRVVTKFQLPEVPDESRTLKAATLRLYLEESTGSGGEVSLWHSASDNDYDQVLGDYDDDSYVDTSLSLVQSDDATGRFYELDVTDLVLADYATDPAIAISAFRLQVDEAAASIGNPQFQFAMTRVRGNHPQLVLTFVPEPSSVVLSVLLVAIFAIRWSRRRCP